MKIKLTVGGIILLAILAVALLYQGGYLTIDRPIDDRTVLLKIPNREVRDSLETGYVSRILGKEFEIDAMQRTAEKA